jgi:class 3 adenylate cyclase
MASSAHCAIHGSCADREARATTVHRTSSETRNVTSPPPGGPPLASPSARGRVRPRAGSHDADRVVATVLFTDVCGSTALAEALGDRAWRGLQLRHDALVGGRVAAHGGREVKRLGDGVLAVFAVPSRAVRCACEIVDAAAGLPLTLRAGLHAGEIEALDRDVSGIAVAIGARIVDLARPAEVLVSRTVRDLTAGAGIAYVDRDRHPLRGILEPWHLYGAVADRSPVGGAPPAA